MLPFLQTHRAKTLGKRLFGSFIFLPAGSDLLARRLRGRLSVSRSVLLARGAVLVLFLFGSLGTWDTPVLAESLLPSAELSEPPALQDQFGVEDDLARHRGHVVVAFVVTAKRLRQLKPWEIALRERFDTSIHFLRVADLPEAAAEDAPEKVGKRLVRHAPEEISVLIDPERHWARIYKLDSSHLNVLVFDGEGHLQAQLQGSFDESLLEIIEREVLHLLFPEDGS